MTARDYTDEEQHDLDQRVSEALGRRYHGWIGWSSDLGKCQVLLDEMVGHLSLVRNFDGTWDALVFDQSDAVVAGDPLAAYPSLPSAICEAFVAWKESTQ